MPQISLWIWLAVVVVAVLVEVFTMDMTSIWFACGGIVALILSAFKNVSWIIQLVVFVILSSLLIIFLRPICKKILLRNANEKTNTDSLIGKKVKMLTTSSFDKLGSVKIADVVWSAMSENEDLTINEGEIVEVLRISGNKLIVRKVEETSTDNN